MISYAFIGRNVEGKGLSNLVSVFSKVQNPLHLFSDYAGNVSGNITCHGWVNQKSIWKVNFDCIILPMTAPETFCYALHEAVAHQKFLIVNEEIKSLMCQIECGVLTYKGCESLTLLLNELNKGTLEFSSPKIKTKRSIWERNYASTDSWM